LLYRVRWIRIVLQRTRQIGIVGAHVKVTMPGQVEGGLLAGSPASRARMVASSMVAEWHAPTRAPGRSLGARELDRRVEHPFCG